MGKETNIHAGHRDRLKRRFLREGIEGFEEHNIVELLLFFGIPFKDTNSIAHNLLKKFGSIKNIFDAPIDEIVRVDGVGEHAATLLKLIPQLCRIYLEQKELNESEDVNNVEKLGRMLINKYVGVNVETVYITFRNDFHFLFSAVCRDSVFYRPLTVLGDGIGRP